MLKLNAGRFGLASAAASFIVWIICSILVFSMGGMMMNMSGYMMHGELSGFSWTMSTTGVLLGGLAWAIAFGITGWLIATLYNAFGGTSA